MMRKSTAANGRSISLQTFLENRRCLAQVDWACWGFRNQGFTFYVTRTVWMNSESWQAGNFQTDNSLVTYQAILMKMKIWNGNYVKGVAALEHSYAPARTSIYSFENRTSCFTQEETESYPLLICTENFQTHVFTKMRPQEYLTSLFWNWVGVQARSVQSRKGCGDNHSFTICGWNVLEFLGKATWRNKRNCQKLLDPFNCIAW